MIAKVHGRKHQQNNPSVLRLLLLKTLKGVWALKGGNPVVQKHPRWRYTILFKFFTGDNGVCIGIPGLRSSLHC